MTAVLEKLYEPSHIRRGRPSTSPTWWVTTDAGARWRFWRKKDAATFIERGCVCPEHERSLCRHCRGQMVTPAPERS